MPSFIANDRAVAALERALREGRVAHAYLFAGPERVGKHALALKLAQALNCEAVVPDPTAVGAPLAAPAGRTVEPCGECNPCRRIAGGLHADVQTVTVEEDEEGTQKGIHVSQIREVERATALKPFEGRSRFVIIDPAEEMNAAAQNAFLKTLEEPPPQVVFALVTADESRLLPTIRSRCRRLELRLPAVAEVEAALAARGVEAERARLLARLSRGRIGWALEAADDASLLERRDAGAVVPHGVLAQLRQPVDVGDAVIGAGLHEQDVAPPVAPRLQRREQRLRLALELRRQPLGEVNAFGDAHRGERARLREQLLPPLQQRGVVRGLQRPADASPRQPGEEACALRLDAPR